MVKKIGVLMKAISENKAVVTRIILFMAVWVNQVLVAKGMQPIPYLDEESISDFLTLVVSIYVLVKDNKISKPAAAEPAE